LPLDPLHFPAAERIDARPGSSRCAGAAIGVGDAGFDSLEELVHFGGIFREDARCQSVLRRVRNRNRFVERANRRDRRHRHEQLVLEDRMAGPQPVDDGGLDEVAMPERVLGDAPASCEQAAAVGSRACDRRLEGAHRGFVDEGTEIHVAIEWIANPYLPGLRDERLHKPIADIAVHEDAGTGRALLALRPERRSHDTVAGLVKIGRGHNDRRVFAAHLGDHRARRRATGIPAQQPQADLPRSGEHHAVHHGMIDQRLTNGGATSGDNVHRARWQAGIAGELAEAHGDPRGRRRRLDHSRISCGERRTGRARCEREREVERGNDRPDSVRPKHAGVAFGRSERLHRPHEPVGMVNLIAVVVDEVGRFLDVAQAFHAVLAALESH